MKRFSFSLIILITLCSFAFAQSKAKRAPAAPAARGGGVQEQLKKLEEEWANALTKRDEAALRRILADDYFIIGPDGTTSNKAGSVNEIKTGGVTITAIKFEDLKV